MSKRSKRSKKDYYNRAKEKVNVQQLNDGKINPNATNYDPLQIPGWIQPDWMKEHSFTKLHNLDLPDGRSAQVVKNGSKTKVVMSERLITIKFKQFTTWLYKSLKAMLNQK